MTDPYWYLTVSTTSLAGLAMLTTAGLAGWRGWLRLKHSELDHAPPLGGPPPASTVGRIELADLRERIKKLEAIAAGVEL